MRGLIYAYFIACSLLIGIGLYGYTNNLRENNMMINQYDMKRESEICYLKEENSRLLTLLEKKEEKKLYLLKVSAYTPRRKECDSTPHITALNKKSRPGKTAAVGSDCLELLGTEIYVKGLGVFHCTDRKPSKGIDLMVGNVKEAKKIGNTTRQVVKIKD